MTERPFSSGIRRQILFLGIVGFFLLMVFQLFTLQVINFEKFDEKSSRNSIKGIKQPAPRGVFFDRNGEVLVSNKPSYTMRITPNQYDTSRSYILDKILKQKNGYVNKILEKKIQYSRFLPSNIKRDVDYEFILWYEEQSDSLPGVDYIVDMRRDYTFGVKGSHFLGYTKEVSNTLLRQRDDIFDMGDRVGFKGIEKTYEEYIRGEKGTHFFIVDSKGKVIRRHEDGTLDLEPKKGNDLILTIDRKVQIRAEEVFKEYSGAIVALEPSTGEILAFVSSPDYNLAEFESVSTGEWWAKLSNNKEKPLFNRATMSIYPPGSTYKMITAIAALEEGIVTKDWWVKCGGGLNYGDRFFGCTHVHGTVAMEKAIEASCNTYFYKLIQKVGLENWNKYSKKFGFGSKTGLDIKEESSGLLPDRDYYNRIYGNRGWSDGVTLNLSIGQGELGVTPIQLASYISLIANNGRSVKPHFVKAYIDKSTGEVIPLEFEDVLVPLKKSTIQIIQNGMEKVFTGKDGTVNHLSISGIKLAGKTGTSQNPFGENHSVFVSYAPADNPQIVVVTFVENMGYGSTFAAPVSLEVIEAYLLKESDQKEKSSEQLIADNLNGIIQ